MSYLLVLGGGESGVGAAILAQKKGIPCRVSDKGSLHPKYKEELDKRNLPYEEGMHSPKWLEEADLVVKSPGIPDTLPMIRNFRDRGIAVISEIEFAYRFIPETTKIIAITGSNGKTTTVNWVTHILKSAGHDAVMCGNVGFSLARLVAEEPHEYYVVEMSSFQLDGVYEFHPNISVLLNITPDHLDRYEYKFELYAQSKMRIAQQLGKNDSFIYWGEDAFITKSLEETPLSCDTLPFTLNEEGGAAVYRNLDHTLFIPARHGLSDFSIPVNELALIGKHNILNAMASALVARELGVSNESLAQSLRDFKNVPHRIEYVGSLQGVDYINDSKATNIQSTFYALEAQTKPVVLILGGTDKGNDYSEIEPLVLAKCRSLIFMGVDNEKLHKAFDGKVPTIKDARSMDECLALAQMLACPGDVVLLSPACASFDLFQNYEDRGDQFREKVRLLQHK